MQKDIIEKLAALITAAFGLVAALAWNDAIKALFVGPCGTEGAGHLCHLSDGGPWAYALFVTVIAVAATVWIGKVAERAKDKPDLVRVVRSRVRRPKKTTKKAKKRK